nr:(3aS,4S,5R,7aS)-5-hydroxy-7a-methyl-1-oxo-octahydro-1H-indene-4-carboxyl-CoA dehydrogenase-like [Nerophis lumbriciformis]
MSPRARLEKIKQQLAAPAVVAPMFLVSGPDMVVAAIRAGLIGAFPAPNARNISIFEDWLQRISSVANASTEREFAGSWAVNLVVHRTYPRLDEEVALLEKYQPPIVITALGSPSAIVERVQAYGGMVIADVNSVAYARKAAAVGVDGLALVSAGAGGHTGRVTGFTFIPAVRDFFDGIIIAAGGICNGQGIRAAEALGADLAYMGTTFIATEESLASAEYKQMVVDAGPDDLVLTDSFSGAPAYYLRESIVRAGLDPDDLQPGNGMNLTGSEKKVKAWKDIWSAGPTAQVVQQIESVGSLAGKIAEQYHA